MGFASVPVFLLWSRRAQHLPSQAHNHPLPCLLLVRILLLAYHDVENNLFVCVAVPAVAVGGVVGYIILHAIILIYSYDMFLLFSLFFFLLSLVSSWFWLLLFF